MTLKDHLGGIGKEYIVKVDAHSNVLLFLTDTNAHRPSAYADAVYQIHRANGHDEVLPTTV